VDILSLDARPRPLGVRSVGAWKGRVFGFCFTTTL
jgi:hypothetical protein